MSESTTMTSYDTTTTTKTLDATVSTVPVLPGFKYPNPTPGAPQKKREFFDEAARNGGAVIERRAQKTLSPHCAKSPAKFPSLVKCYRFVEIYSPTTSTKTQGSTTTITAPTPVTTTTETDTTVVTTVLPNASTTVTETSTSTELSTSIETNTVTKT